MLFSLKCFHKTPFQSSILVSKLHISLKAPYYLHVSYILSTNYNILILSDNRTCQHNLQNLIAVRSVGYFDVIGESTASDSRYSYEVGTLLL